MTLADAHGLPIAIHAGPAAPAEAKLVEATLAARLVEEKLLRSLWTQPTIAIRYASNCSQKRSCFWPRMRRGRTKPSFSDGRWLRRYNKRWKSERLFAWLHNFRRLV